MIDRNATRIYTFFIASTLAAATLFFFGLKTFFGINHALFFVFLFAHGHYVTAYLWSIPTYARMPRTFRRCILGVWGTAALLFYCAVFLWQVISLHTAVLFLVISTSFHFFRDYEFFYRQLISGLRDRRRTRSLTCMLTGFYLMVVFGAVLFDPEKTRSLFGVPLAPTLTQAVFWGSVALFVVGGIIIVRDKKHRVALRAGILEHAQAAVSVTLIPVLSVLSRLSLLDLYVLFSVWHYSLWLAFTAIKIGHASERRLAAAMPRQETRTALEVVLYYWKRDTRSFIVLTAALYAILIGFYAISFILGLSPSIIAARHQSFFWGIGGFVFFSIAHISFTALPRPASAVQ